MKRSDEEENDIHKTEQKIKSTLEEVAMLIESINGKQNGKL